jgi:hypothetical protein
LRAIDEAFAINDCPAKFVLQLCPPTLSSNFVLEF